MRKYLKLIIMFSFFSVFSQNDEQMIKKIFDSSLFDGKSYELLDYLSNEIGGSGWWRSVEFKDIHKL